MPHSELVKYNTTLSLLNDSRMVNIFMPILKIRKPKPKEVNNWTILSQQISLGRKAELKSHVGLSDTKCDLQCDHFHPVLINDSHQELTV